MYKCCVDFIRFVPMYFIFSDYKLQCPFSLHCISEIKFSWLWCVIILYIAEFDLLVFCWLIGKDSDAGRDWGQEEKGTTEDEMAWWHHWLNGHESGWTPGVGDGQGGLACWFMGLQRVGQDWATELIIFMIMKDIVFFFFSFLCCLVLVLGNTWLGKNSTLFCHLEEFG